MKSIIVAALVLVLIAATNNGVTGFPLAQLPDLTPLTGGVNMAGQLAAGAVNTTGQVASDTAKAVSRTVDLTSQVASQAAFQATDLANGMFQALSVGLPGR